MKKTYCDICEAEMPQDKPGAPPIKYDFLRNVFSNANMEDICTDCRSAAGGVDFGS